jgi:hypothetical protein
MVDAGLSELASHRFGDSEKNGGAGFFLPAIDCRDVALRHTNHDGLSERSFILASSFLHSDSLACPL